MIDGSLLTVQDRPLIMMLVVSVEEQEKLQINVSSMIEDELGWLSNFVPSENADTREIDNILLAGHLKLIKTLLTCAGLDKREIGKILEYVFNVKDIND